MIDGNISIEEDTELRDLVVQTLENNGVLAKVRAELRASVFLTLEEQESVLNPEPLLNKSVKQYLAKSEGKLLFSLVREFLEYFGLDYTISVYDPETYFGKEYNYEGRKKLCEELGINSREPLLGEILKNSINGALNNTEKGNSSHVKLDKTGDTSNVVGNATFNVSISKVSEKDSNSISMDTSEKLESISNPNIQVTITDKKQNETLVDGKNVDSPVFRKTDHDKKDLKYIHTSENNDYMENSTNESNYGVTNETHLNDKSKSNQSPDTSHNKKGLAEFQTVNNVKNKKVEPINNLGKTLYFDEIIVDGSKEKVNKETKSDTILLGELPPLAPKSNSIFGDLPPLNGKKADLSDMKELMDIAQGVSQYDDDFPSSASSSINEQSSSKIQYSSKNQLKVQNNMQGSGQNLQSENESEEIDSLRN